MQHGGRKTMAELTIGDRVLVAPSVFSEVYMFSHRYVDAVSPFVKISTANSELLITADHYLYVNGALSVASTVKVGRAIDFSCFMTASCTCKNDMCELHCRLATALRRTECR